jgi:broad specificity phosphatase PhoE
MKKTIFTILILLTFNCIQSQTIVDLSEFNQGDNNGKYFKDVNNNFQNFLGTWEGLISNTKTFRINLFKITKNIGKRMNIIIMKT